MNKLEMATKFSTGMPSFMESYHIDDTLITLAEGYISLNPGCSYREVFQHLEKLLPELNWMTVGLFVYNWVEEKTHYNKEK